MPGGPEPAVASRAIATTPGTSLGIGSEVDVTGVIGGYSAAQTCGVKRIRC
jgi:hypothetical protein